MKGKVKGRLRGLWWGVGSEIRGLGGKRVKGEGGRSRGWWGGGGEGKMEEGNGREEGKKGDKIR